MKVPGDKGSTQIRSTRKQTSIPVMEKELLLEESKAKCCKAAKAISKQKCQDLVKSLKSTKLNTLQCEMHATVEEQFEDSNLRGFIDEILKENEPMMKIARQLHCM